MIKERTREKRLIIFFDIHRDARLVEKAKKDLEEKEKRTTSIHNFVDIRQVIHRSKRRKTSIEKKGQSKSTHCFVRDHRSESFKRVGRSIDRSERKKSKLTIETEKNWTHSLVDCNRPELAETIHRSERQNSERGEKKK